MNVNNNFQRNHIVAETPKHLTDEGVPSTKEYQELYAAIGNFRETKPYIHIGSENCFGIREENGEIRWVIILGQAGEEFGISIFYGDRSFNSFYDLLDNQNSPDLYPFRTLNGCYFNLVNKSDLEKEDIQNLKEREFTTFGRGKGWPLLRRYLPHHVMTHLATQKDIKAMLHTLTVLPEVISDLQNECFSFDLELSPVLSFDSEGNRVWEMVEPQFDEEIAEDVSYDPFIANRIQSLPASEQELFIGSPLLFIPIGTEDPLTLPETVALVDTASGMIVDFGILEHGDNYNALRISRIIEYCITNESTPSTILVDNLHLVEPLTEIFKKCDTEVIHINTPEPFLEMLSEMVEMMNMQ